MSFFFKKPFSENGDITQIPTNDQGNGNVSYEKGWPEGYEIDPNTDPDEARNLSRTNFNGLFFNITEALQQLQIYGVNPFITSSDNDDEPYAYPVGGTCYYIDPATGEFGVYKSIQSNNTETPMTNGIVSPLWQREFDPLLDSIKSNRIYNVPLRYPQVPSITIDENGLTLTIYAYSKFLFANGVYEDDSLNNNIILFNNNKVLNYPVGEYQTSGQFFWFATSDEGALFLDITQYSDATNEADVIDSMGKVSTSDVYYFDRITNEWKIRVAGQTNFTSLGYSLCLIAQMFMEDNVISEYTEVPPLRIFNEQEVKKELEKKQNILTTGNHISIQPMNNSQDFIKANLPVKATPFCVNSCNINESTGAIDLLYSDTAINIKDNESTISPFGANGRVTSGSYCYNATNMWGGQYETYFNTGGSRKVTTTCTFTYTTPIEITSYGANLTFSWYVPKNPCKWGNPHAERQFWVDLIFTDGTTTRMYTSSTYTSNGSGWNNFKKTFPSSTYNKQLKSIQFSVYMYCYCTYNSYTFLYLKDANVQISRRDIVFNTSNIYFKTGSNYLDQLNTEGNADLMMDNDHAIIRSSHEELSAIWKDSVVSLKDWWTDFETSYEFQNTPAETNNAKLFLRYNDIDAEGILSNFSIVLTYWGGATYTLLDDYSFFKTRDLLLDIPNGKYLQKITIAAKEIQNLSGSSFGMIRLYNNVSNEITFTQYPAIYATSADGSSYMMLNNVPPITLYQPGYVMLSNDKAYILPGTNVIRKQKKQPTVNDDPRLTNGDVWLDLSSEPLCAYQYFDGVWHIFNDVPVGYVQADYLSPTATATVEGTGITAATVNANTFKTKISAAGVYTFTYNGSNWKLEDTTVTLSNYGISVTGTPVNGDEVIVDFDLGNLIIQSITQYPINQNGYNINTFTENLGSLSGRDGRDGKDGKDGKNGTPGAQGPAGVGVPAGGNTGQSLVKNSNTSYDTKWATITGVPTGGTTGQSLVKNSNTNYDLKWETLEALPPGGTTGQTIIKQSSTDGDYDWGTLEALPEGGTTGQVLSKSSDTNYDVTWTDVLTSSIFNGGTTGQTLIKNSSTNLDFSWGKLETLPEGGITGQVLSKSSNTNYDVGWTTVHYIPSGGTIGQALVKVNGDDYNVQWTNIIPNGGTTNQVLAKNSNNDMDTSWITIVPNGGTTGQSLVKNSNSDLDTKWETILGLPSGGNTNYVLSKTSNIDYEVNWRESFEVPDGGLPGQVLMKKTGTDHDTAWAYVSNETGAAVANLGFKTDSYFYAAVNQYTGMALEQFINMDGIATADQEDVLPYYYSPHASILNSSEETLVFDLKPINFGGLSQIIYLRTEHTDTVTFSYSVDNGTTFTSLSEEVDTSCETTELILRITMSAGSEVKNIGLLVK